jgi:ribonuclease P protein component
VRNRLKRHIRESFRLLKPGLPPVDVVVLANRAAATTDPASLRRSLAQHFARLQSQCAASS